MEAGGRAMALAAVAATAAAAVAAAAAYQRPGGGSGAALPLVAAAAAAAAAVVALRPRQPAGCSAAAFASYPRQYAAPRGTPAVIDGDLSKDVWQRAPWSEPFLEIRGLHDAPDGSGPGELQATKMKMLWDDTHLYVGAVLDYAEGDELVAEFTQRNSPIFHTDSDFEVFIDPAGCCHGYKELELNALNTVWNLMLNRPYMDGGGEFSGRVAKEGEPNFWEVRAQKTAARVLRGALREPSRPAQWCCELALAHADNLPLAPVRGPTPEVGACWRINFSRVEKKGAVNWVWSPQLAWSPSAGRFVGQVNMHLPDAWGYVVFADERGRLTNGKPAAQWRDPAWPARHAAACLYHAARAFRAEDKRWPRSLAELEARGLLPNAAALAGCRATVTPTSGTSEGFIAEVSCNGLVAEIGDNHMMRVRRGAAP